MNKDDTKNNTILYVKCYHCKGKGLVMASGEEIDCPICKGTGTVKVVNHGAIDWSY